MADKKEVGELAGLYDLRISFGTGLPYSESVARAIRDCFNRNKGKLDKKLMDKTIKALSKNHPKYTKVWKEFKKTFEIEVHNGQYVNPFCIDNY